MKKQLVVNKLLKVLKERYGKEIGIHPWDRDVFKVLISTILSQRTRGENTEKAASNLFSKADTPEKILKLSTKQLQKLIRPSGPFRQKAKRIKKDNKYKSLTHSEALDIVAKEYGYQNWSLLMRHVNRYHTAFLSMPRLEDNK